MIPPAPAPPPALIAIASELAGKPTQISCDAPSSFAPGVMGDVQLIDGHIVATIHLPAPTCKRLATLATANVIIPSDVLTFSHEIQHVALDSGDECVVERAALANLWQVVRRLRLPAWRARVVLAGAAYVDAHMPAEYHGCSA